MAIKRSFSVVTWKECCIVTWLTLTVRSIIDRPDKLDTNSTQLYSSLLIRIDHLLFTMGNTLLTLTILNATFLSHKFNETHCRALSDITDFWIVSRSHFCGQAAHSVSCQNTQKSLETMATNDSLYCYCFSFQCWHCDPLYRCVNKSKWVHV